MHITIIGEVSIIVVNAGFELNINEIFCEKVEFKVLLQWSSEVTQKSPRKSVTYRKQLD